ncbi:MAG: GNAT family N-acetyltransferase [Hyphomicrobiaceae bacterium]
MLWSRTSADVRPARVSDAEGLVLVHREAWLSAYRGLIPHDQLEQLVTRRTPSWWRSAIRSKDRVTVLESDGEIVGYATCGRARGRSATFEGEIYELYLRPDHQGLGYGEYLFEACRALLDERGYRGLLVWVLSDNDRALSFYWARGGRAVARTTERFGNVRLGKIALGWD